MKTQTHLKKISLVFVNYQKPVSLSENTTIESEGIDFCMIDFEAPLDVVQAKMGDSMRFHSVQKIDKSETFEKWLVEKFIADIMIYANTMHRGKDSLKSYIFLSDEFMTLLSEDEGFVSQAEVLCHGDAITQINCIMTIDQRLSHTSKRRGSFHDYTAQKTSTQEKPN